MQAFICDAVRTPIGRYGCALAEMRADDLAAAPLSALRQRNPQVDWSTVEDVIFGCANQVGEDNRNVARMAALLADLPVSVPGTTDLGSRAAQLLMRQIASGNFEPESVICPTSLIIRSSCGPSRARY